MSRKRPRRVTLSFTQRQPDGRMHGIEVDGVVITQVGTDEQIGKILLEAEQYGNAGNCRVHIFLKG